MNDALTELEKAEYRMRCVEVAVTHGTKMNMERDACLDAAKVIYKYVVGTTPKKAPRQTKRSG